MDGGRVDVTAFQLAAELASSTDTSASPSPPPHTTQLSSQRDSARHNPHNFHHSLGSDALQDRSLSSHQHLMPLGEASSAKRPPVRVSQLDRLVSEQQHFANRGGPPAHGRPAAASAASASASTTATSTNRALQEAMMRWGLVKNAQGDFFSAAGRLEGLVGDGRVGASSSPTSSPYLRHSWRLVEVTRQPTVAAASPAVSNSAAPPTVGQSWSVGERWERSDDLLQAQALLKAVQGEAARLPQQQQQQQAQQHQAAGGFDKNDNTNSICNSAGATNTPFYTAALHLCAESTRSAASLPATLSGVSASPSSHQALSLFTFTEDEYNALSLSSPPPPPPASTTSQFTFTYDSACYLIQLWSRFGNPVVVRDRWAYQAQQNCNVQASGSAGAATHKFRFRSADAPTATLALTEAEIHPERESCTSSAAPSVEQLCAEYYRVTTGVLQQRQQRLLHTVLMTQQENRSTPTQEGAQVTGAKASKGAASSSSRVKQEHPSNTHTPFVASFNRYALLRSAKGEAAEVADASRSAKAEPEQEHQHQRENEATLLPSQPSPPPRDPRAVAMPANATVVKAEGASEDGAVHNASDEVLQTNPVPHPAAAAAHLTPQQRLTQCITPHPWYDYASELQRRAAVEALLRCEGETNVPYQHAASRYLALVISAAQALQRASLVFDDRDREEAEAEERDRRAREGATPEATPVLTLKELRDGLTRETEVIISGESLESSMPSEMTPHATVTADTMLTPKTTETTTTTGGTGTATRVRSLTVPPRTAFTVQLQPLPSIDPAAWKTTEAALRKAAVEVLGAAAFAAKMKTQKGAVTKRAGRKRARSGQPAAKSVGKFRNVAKMSKKAENESVRAAASATAKDARKGRGAKDTHKKENAASTGGGDDDDLGVDGDDVPERASSESSLADDSADSSDVSSDNDDEDGDSSSRSDSSNSDSEADEEESEDEGSVDDDDNATTHLSQTQNSHERSADDMESGAAAATKRRFGRPAKSASRLSTSTPQPAAQGAQPATDTTYRSLQEFIREAVPFRCTRMRATAQAGWLLPAPPPLPHSLTDPLEEREVVLVDVEAAMACGGGGATAGQRGPKVRENAEGRVSAKHTGLLQQQQQQHKSNASRTLPEATAPPSTNSNDSNVVDPLHTMAATSTVVQESLYDPILTEDDYQALRKVSTAAVCNRVVSHTGEAVLLTLPPALPLLHREVEQELERYLYDDTSAMMEVNATAQSLMAEIRIAYTQNTYLQRYSARLEHVVEALRKVELECREVEKSEADLKTS